MNRWSLTALYEGYEDDNYKKDITELEHIVNVLKQKAKDKWNTASVTENTEEVLKEAVSLLEHIYCYIKRQSILRVCSSQQIPQI